MESRCCFSTILCGLLVLFLSVSAFPAALKQVPSSHVPVAVARGDVAPIGPVPDTNELRLSISLPLRNAAALTNFLREVYDPASPQYRHFLSTEEFTERFGPTPEDYATVTRFAETNGLKITATHPDRLLVDVTSKASSVERAFHVRMNSYRHPNEDRNFFAPDTEPSVDSALPILHISGLNNYSRPHPNFHLITNSPAVMPLAGSAGGAYRGNDFRKAYAPGSSLTGAGQSVAQVQFDDFYASDISTYANAIGIATVPQLIVVPVDGGVPTPGGASLEVSLDIEMVLSLSPGVSKIYLYEARPAATTWVSMLSRIANDNFAKQVSCSWIGGGPDPGAEQVFQQMAAQGQSFFSACGDAGAYTGAIGFPADSPNITQVGGTTLTTDANGNYLSETVWNAGGGTGTGGGISTSYSIPDWQLGISMDANQGSTTMRNIPDVALAADNISVIHDNGRTDTVGGTSCAAPLWAAFMALINEQAAQLGQPPIGFVNPALYALGRGPNFATVFHDITVGSNTKPSSPANFFAVQGFDLCTGLGSPNGVSLINALVTSSAPPVAFATVKQSGADIQFTWNSAPGLKYQIQFTTDLFSPNWKNLGTVAATGNVCNFADANAIRIADRRYYRLVLLP